MNAPTGRWKKVLALVAGGLSLALWVNIFLRKIGEFDACECTGCFKHFFHLISYEKIFLKCLLISEFKNFFLQIFTTVLPEVPRTVNEEWRVAQLEKMVRQRIGHVDGVSSKWDYENQKWK